MRCSPAAQITLVGADGFENWKYQKERHVKCSHELLKSKTPPAFLDGFIKESQHVLVFRLVLVAKLAPTVAGQRRIWTGFPKQCCDVTWLKLLDPSYLIRGCAPAAQTSITTDAGVMAERWRGFFAPTGEPLLAARPTGTGSSHPRTCRRIGCQSGALDRSSTAARSWRVDLTC